MFEPDDVNLRRRVQTLESRVWTLTLFLVLFAIAHVFTLVYFHQVVNGGASVGALDVEKLHVVHLVTDEHSYGKIERSQVDF